jgi:hyperosmotically inducible periplasmic protein
MNKTSFAVLVLSSAISCSAVLAQSPTTVAPDNAKSNKVDASNATTADSQANNATDLDLTKRIRQSVMADKSLSTYAHNVKIVTVNGAVTLNGVVRSEDEKGAVGKKAVDVVGKDKVTNDLKIAPSSH